MLKEDHSGATVLAAADRAPGVAFLSDPALSQLVCRLGTMTRELIQEQVSFIPLS